MPYFFHGPGATASCMDELKWLCGWSKKHGKALVMLCGRENIMMKWWCGWSRKYDEALVMLCGRENVVMKWLCGWSSKHGDALVILRR
jgi:hypothetical protein